MLPFKYLAGFMRIHYAVSWFFFLVFDETFCCCKVLVQFFFKFFESFFPIILNEI